MVLNFSWSASVSVKELADRYELPIGYLVTHILEPAPEPKPKRKPRAVAQPAKVVKLAGPKLPVGRPRKVA